MGSQGNVKAPVPKAHQLSQLADRRDVNYVKYNQDRVQMEQHQGRRQAAPSESDAGAVIKPKNYGKVPEYIHKYNREREAAAKQRLIDEENAKLPPGTRLMPEEERLSTLADLLAAKKQTNTDLERLPIQAKSLRMAQHKRDLEEKMTKLERAIETFSKKQVYIQV